MKRFYAFLCAAMLVLSTTAAPQFKSFKPAAQPNKLLAVKAQKPSGVKTAVPVKITDKKQLLEQTYVSKAAKAPKAKQTTTDVAVSKASATYYEADNDIYYALYNEDKSVIYCFDILCAEGQQDVESGKTYTLDDMLADYCEWVPANDMYNGTAFTAASFTKTVAADGSYTIVASATDANGDIFNLSYAESAFVPQTYNLTMAKASFEYYSSSSDMYISMNDADENYYFYFDIILPSGQQTLVSGKTYTLDDMDAQYTKGADYVQMEYIDYASASFTRTDAADGSFTVSAVVVDKKGNTWNISYAQAAPQISEKTLNLQGFVQTGSSMQQIEAANADSTELVSLIIITSADSLIGSFTEEDLLTMWGLSYVLYDSVEYDIDKANITVAYNKTDSLFVVTGTITCVNPDDAADIVIFTLNLSCIGQMPEPVEPVAVPDSITGSGFTLDYNSSSWQLAGEVNEDAYLAIMAYSNTVAGHYGAADLDDYYTYIGLGGSVYYDMTDANLDVTFENNIVAVKGTLKVANEEDPTDVKTVYLDITGIYTPPTERHYTYDETTPFEAVIPTYQVDSTYLAKYGELVVSASNATDNKGVALEFFVKEGESTLVPGEYPIDNSQNPGTLYASIGLDSDGYLTYSFAGIKGTQGWTNIWFLVAGKATINENGVITIAGLNSNNQQVNVVLGQNPTGIESAKAASKVTKRVINGQIVIEKNGVLYNTLGTFVK